MIACLFAAAVATSAGSFSGGVDRSVLAFADDLLSKGETERARGEYERYLFLCPGCERAPYARLRLAEAERRAGDPAAAAIRLAALARELPDRPEGGAAAAELPAVLAAAGDLRGASDAARAAATLPGEPGSALELSALRFALRARDAGRARAALAAGALPDATQSTALSRALEDRRLPHRSPALAAGLSAVLPGAGQVYAGHLRDGVTSFLVNGLFLSSTVIAARNNEVPLAVLLGGLEVFWYGGNVIGAMNSARRYDEAAEANRWREMEHRYLPAELSLSFRFP